MIAASCHQIIECIIRTFDRETGHRPPVPLPQGRHLEDRKKAVRKTARNSCILTFYPNSCQDIGMVFCVLYKLRAEISCTIPLCKIAGSVLYYSQKG